MFNHRLHTYLFTMHFLPELFKNSTAWTNFTGWWGGGWGEFLSVCAIDKFNNLKCRPEILACHWNFLQLHWWNQMLEKMFENKSSNALSNIFFPVKSIAFMTLMFFPSHKFLIDFFSYFYLRAVVQIRCYLELTRIVSKMVKSSKFCD